MLKLEPTKDFKRNIERREIDTLVRYMISGQTSPNLKEPSRNSDKTSGLNNVKSSRPKPRSSKLINFIWRSLRQLFNSRRS